MRRLSVVWLGRVYALQLALSAIGCHYTPDLYCSPTQPCQAAQEDPSLSFCDVRGDYPESMGHGNTCIHDPRPDASPLDASFDGAADAAAAVDSTRDAEGPPDAASDAAPPTPPVVTGQYADLVLGQPDFTASAANQGSATPASSTLNSPGAVACDGTRVWVSDSSNYRVLQWNSLPTVNAQVANVVIGQASMTTRVPGVGQAQLGSVVDVASDGTRVYVLEASPNNRLLIFDPIPAANGALAIRVLGQPNFTTTGSGTAASQLSHPQGLWTDGTRILVADTSNNRVLLWSSYPTSNQAPADVVLGQPAFGTAGAPSPPTAASMNAPQGVYFDGTRLYVADSGNHRVMVWSSMPSSNDQPADYFIGQTSGDSGAAQAGAGAVNEAGLRLPTAVLVASGSLFVSDTFNRRVVVYTPMPSASGPSASAVLGQDDFVSAVSYPTGQNRLSVPAGIAASANKLFVVDAGSHRVLRFNLSP